MTFDREKEYNALARLLEIARRDTGQSRKVADFLLAWYNAAENGGWDPVDMWGVDASIADDMLTVLHLIRVSNRYPDDLGFEKEIKAVWELWRGRSVEAKQSSPDSNETPSL